MHGGGKGGVSLEGGDRITERLLVDYADRMTALRDLKGYTIQQSGGNLVKVPPLQHPVMNWLYCTDASFESVGQQFQDLACTDYPVYQKTIIEATFTPLPIHNGPDPPPYDGQIILVDQVQGGVEYKTVNGVVTWYYDSTDVGTENTEDHPPYGMALTDTKPAIQCPVITHTLTLYFWPNPGYNFNQHAGKVNDRDFRFLFETFEAETLLFEHATWAISVTTDGTFAHDVGMLLIHRPQGWNKQPWYNQSTGTAEFYPVFPKPFKTYDFRNLFPQ